jgi:general secretion pathway protein F
MKPTHETLIAMLAILMVGIVILIVKPIVFRPRWPAKRHPLEFALNILGWGMVYWVTTCLLFVYVNVLLGLLWFFAIPCIAVFARLHNHRIKKQGFLRVLALAAEKEMPLIPVIEAYAYETGGSFGDRIADFSTMLQNGVPLPDALRMAPGLISTDHYPIIFSGYESGTLAKGFREAAAPDLHKPVWGSISSKLLYIAAMIWIGCGMLIFMLTKLIPAFEKIFKDYGKILPPVTREFIEISHLSIVFMPVIFLVFFFFLFLFIYSMLKFYGVIVFELPGLGRLLRRKHAAEILNNLALAVESHRTIDSGIHTLARCYPNRSIREKLSQSLLDVQSGVSWCESLFRRGLMRQSDLAVLQAAERAGNLPWAMREIADVNRRRLVCRMNVLVQLLFPPVVICFGGMLLFIVIAMLKPLIDLTIALRS